MKITRTNSDRNNQRRGLAALLGALALGTLAAAAPAELVFTTEYGIEFSTIGDVGNPIVPQSVGPMYYSGGTIYPVGAVEYEYRISRTEITVSQWHEFVTAYRPHYTAGNPNSQPFTGFYITWSNAQQQYTYSPGVTDHATDPSWRVAAAYCNWLHNDKASEAWAFESGAYDISTFTANPDGSLNDQRERSPGARFWIPSLDEWTKAMHWDPDRYGPGEGGYWTYPTSSDEAPISGVPGVGQTNAGLPGASSSSYFPVASYPDVMSPWGLWDGSGTEREWTETFISGRWRWSRGSAPGLDPDIWDRVDTISVAYPAGHGFGFRIAAAIPTPHTLWLAGLLMLNQVRKRSTKQ